MRMKYIVFFDDKADSSVNLVGGKGWGLQKMTQLGLPVPFGFTITTDTWREFNERKEIWPELLSEIKQGISQIEERMGKKFGDVDNPLLVSVRSGARYSMPGMMETILNVGISKEIIPSLSKSLGNEKYAWDTYSRFIKMYSQAVFNIHKGEFDLLPKTESISNEDLSVLYENYIKNKYSKVIPESYEEKLITAIKAVFDSWNSHSAVGYRQMNGIPNDLGTAVNVQAMVFGNRENSGTGVLFTRNTISGEKGLVGDYLENGQGEDIVRGASERQTLSMVELENKHSEIYKEIKEYALLLEKNRGNVQDIEFTVENGKVWMLQSRNAACAPVAKIRIMRDLNEEGLVSEDVALSSFGMSDINSLITNTFNDEQEKTAILVAHGQSASSGVANGVVAITPEDVESLRKIGKSVIWVSDHIDPNDVSTLRNVVGVITTKGTPSSHMGLVLRAAGIPGVMGCKDITIDSANKMISGLKTKFEVGDQICLNSTLGNVYCGSLPVHQMQMPEDVKNFVNKRIDKFGESLWTSGIYNDEKAPKIEDLTLKIKNIYTDIYNKWKSPKSRVAEIYSQVFPKELVYPTWVMRAGDKDGIKEKLIDVIKIGGANYPRTCHHPIKLAGAPWADGPHKIEDVDKFIELPDFPGKYGGYPKWIADETLESIIVCCDPVGKLDPTLLNKHFAGTLVCLATHPASVVLTLNFGAIHLRSLEQVPKEDLVMVKVNLNQWSDYKLGNFSYRFGKKHLVAKEIEVLFKENDTIKEICRLSKKEVDWENLSLQGFYDLIDFLSEEGVIPWKLLTKIVDPKTMSLTKSVSSTLFENWWRPPVSLPILMSVLDNIIGMSVLEIQGRFEEEKIEWIKIYGAKGAEEKEKISA